MTRPTIVVTGAAGRLGTQVVHHLLAEGWPVRALVRRYDARSTALADAGAEIAEADLADPQALAQAMRGARRAVFIPAFGPYMTHMAAAFADAARVIRLESVVSLSQWLASPDHPSFATRQHWLIDRLLGALPGTSLTVVNPGFFADNVLRTLPYAAHLGVLPWLYGDGLNAPPSNEDIAAVVAHALMHPERHAGRKYRPTGPALLSGDDMVRIVAKVVGHRVVKLPMPFWMFSRAARLDGAGIDELLPYRSYIEDYRSGAFEIGAPTNDVLEVTGRAPEDFETIARRYAARPGARPAMANRLKQFALFMAVPFVPGYDLKHRAAALREPGPAASQRAVDSPTWRLEHGIPAADVMSNRNVRAVSVSAGS